MITESVFATAHLVNTAVYLWSCRHVRRFLEGTPAIGDERALRRYKEFVRTQMRLGLFVLCLLIVATAAGAILVWRHGFTGVAVVMLAGGWVYALGRHLKPLETRARALNASSEPLQREYCRVSRSWLKKALPDF